MTFGVENRRELVLDDGQFPLVLHQLRKDVLGDAARPFLLKALQGPPAELGVLDARHQFVRPDREVPQFQRLHPAELRHRLAVGADAGHCHVLGSSVSQAVIAAGHHEACREALDVPLPGRRKGFVEIVDGKDDTPFGRGKAAEVTEVGVPAALDVDPGGRRRCKVGGHREGRPAVKRERGANHAAVAEGEQVGHPPFLGPQNQFDRVRPAGGGFPDRVRAAGTGFSQRLPRGVPLRVGPDSACLG